jgi:hypothetical protein
MPGNRPGYDPSLQKIVVFYKVLDQPVRIQYKTKGFKKEISRYEFLKTAFLKTKSLGSRGFFILSNKQ